MNARSNPPAAPRTLLAALMLAVTALLSLMVTAFAWPASQLAPRDLPVAVSGSDQDVAALEQRLAAGAGHAGAFDVTRTSDRAAALQAVQDHEAYAALVATPGGVELLTASAGSPMVAQLMTQLALQTTPPGASPPQIVDVVPLPDDDPRGATFAAGALPLVIGGIATGAIVALRVPRRRPRLVALAAISVLGGLGMAGVLQGWLGALEGSYLANSAVISLGLAATATMIVGMHARIGAPGIGLVAAVTMFLGNPLSGISSAPDLLPTGWGQLGQWLPPGATGTALRSTAFFDGAGSLGSVAVLLAWIAVGLGLVALSARRTPAPSLAEPSLVPAGA